MRVAPLLLAATLGSVLAARSPELPVRDPDLEALAAEATAVPPEFAADILLQIAAARQVVEAWKRELIDEAFVDSHAAPEPFNLQIAAFVPVDSREAARIRAARPGLTA